MVGVVEDEPAAVAGQDKDVAAVRIREQLLVQDHLGRAGRDHAAVHERGLVEALGGTIEALPGESGRGTNMEIRLPQPLRSRVVDPGEELEDEEREARDPEPADRRDET